MFEPLEVPVELDHLIEKRDTPDRRRKKRRKPEGERATDSTTKEIGPAKDASEEDISKKTRSGPERRKSKERRKMIRRLADDRKNSNR